MVEQWVGAGRFLERSLSSEEQCSGQRGGAMGRGMRNTGARAVSTLEDRVCSAPGHCVRLQGGA